MERSGVLHHEEHGRQDEAGVGGVGEDVPDEGREVFLYRLHDDFVHLLPATGGRSHRSQSEA